MQTVGTTTINSIPKAEIQESIPLLFTSHWNAAVHFLEWEVIVLLTSAASRLVLGHFAWILTMLLDDDDDELVVLNDD